MTGGSACKAPNIDHPASIYSSESDRDTAVIIYFEAMVEAIPSSAKFEASDHLHIDLVMVPGEDRRRAAIGAPFLGEFARCLFARPLGQAE